MAIDTFYIMCGEEDMKVKDLLTEQAGFSKRLLEKLDMGGKITIEGKTTTLHKTVFRDEVIQVDFLDEKEDIPMEKMDLEVIYEDQDLLAINKNPYLVVHPTKSHDRGTLANGLAQYFEESGINRKVRFVNRLDMNTSGVLLVAKNPHVHHLVSAEMKQGKIEKTYIACVNGKPNKHEGVLNAPILKEKGSIKSEVNLFGKACETHYRLVNIQGNFSCLEVKLITGRTHQIRVHMANEGMPILGDTLYGEESLWIGRQALHCYSMAFAHPRTGDSVFIKATLPDDMSKLIIKESI